MTTEYPLTEQLRELRREIAMRERVFPQWVADGKMTQRQMDERLGALKAAAETVAYLVAQQSPELPI